MRAEACPGPTSWAFYLDTSDSARTDQDMSIHLYLRARMAKLRTVEKALLKEMAMIADEAGERIYPSVATLAAYLGVSRRTVQNALRSLQRGGWIAAAGSKRGGAGFTTCYRINLEALPASAQELHPSPEKGAADARGSASPAKKGAARAQMGAARTPNRLERQNRQETDGYPFSKMLVRALRRRKTMGGQCAIEAEEELKRLGFTLVAPKPGSPEAEAEECRIEEMMSRA